MPPPPIRLCSMRLNIHLKSTTSFGNNKLYEAEQFPNDNNNLREPNNNLYELGLMGIATVQFKPLILTN